MNDEIQFLVDENLLGLVRQLRMMGVDAASYKSLSDDELLTISEKENRILLTKDRRLFHRIPEGRGYLVQSEPPEEQLLEVLKHFSIGESDEALARCFECNTLIEEVPKESVRDRVDAKTFAIYDVFYECPTCHRIYWEGSHFEKLLKKVERIRNAVRK
ncbi:Mut7-C RNAse domain-containing protein [Bdellovibrio sp. HCB-162]|uniref:Mut7-C RNAse domain-containing protein n=1 Tax=Bdellovibrio sp. HCB-162 TaxID=3394234 RepID=UPI0039BC5421